MNSVPPRPRGRLLAPALMLALWLLFSIGARPLLLPDEGRYAGVALEMLRGDALQPTLDGLPFFHKPPLLYWLDLLPLRLLGTNEFAARCAPALFGWLLGMALFLHLRRRHGEAVARTGLLVLATSPLFFLGAQYVNHDIGVAACITAALLATLRAVEDPRRVALRWLVLGWMFCGLGVLAKGLIGIVLPAAVIGPWLLAQGRWRQVLALLHPAALLVFGAVALPWMVAMQLRHPAFYDYFIVEQHFRRFTGTDFNNRMPFWFFVVVLPLLMLPWTLWLAPALRRLRPVDPLLAFYAWWIVVIVGFFSLPESKLVGYVMPALAPMAALLALVLVERPRATRRAGWIGAAFCVAVVGALAWKQPGSRRDLARALAAARAPGERVVFIDDDYYDVPFYADLKAPVVIVSSWDDPDIARHDNWRKELADAARFAPDRGRSTLWTWDRVPELNCTPGRVWLLAPADQVARLAALAQLKVVRAERGVELLVAPGRDCAKAP